MDLVLLMVVVRRAQQEVELMLALLAQILQVMSTTMKLIQEIL